MKEGYLLCCFGNSNYFNLAKRMISEIRKFDSKRKICVLTDNINFFKNLEIIAIKFDYKDHEHKNINITNDWNKYGLLPKIYQYKYTPFETTCFMDVDMLFHKDFTFIWDEFKKEKKCILIGGKSDENNRSPSDWHWGKIHNIIKRCGFNCPQICGTVFIYDEEYKNLVEKLPINYVLDNIKKFNFKNLFNGGYPDEIFYSLILGKMKLRPSKLLDEWFYNKKNCDSCNKIIHSSS